MKIAAINNNVNFKRAIVIQSSPNANNRELVNVLNCQNSKIYSKKEARQLRLFFREILGDYGSKSENVILRTTSDGDSVLLSGQDSREVQEVEAQKQRTRKLIWNSSKLSQEKKQKLIKKLYQDEETTVKSKIENGKNGKANTNLLTEVSPNNGKISHIDYESMKIEYTMIENGHVMTKEEFEKSDKHARCLRSVLYEKKSFDLKG